MEWRWEWSESGRGEERKVVVERRWSGVKSPVSVQGSVDCPSGPPLERSILALVGLLHVVSVQGSVDCPSGLPLERSVLALVGLLLLWLDS